MTQLITMPILNVYKHNKMFYKIEALNQTRYNVFEIYDFLLIENVGEFPGRFNYL